MIELFNRLSNKYFLQLGDYKFSPITKLTVGISLEYAELVKKNICEKEPFIYCLPEKKAAALWTSIAILTNYYLEDYVNIGDEGIELSAGDKVSIYNCVAQVERVTNGTIVLKFKDQGGLHLKNRLKTQLSHAKPSRSLNLLRKYTRERIKARNNRNPISKILYPNEEVFINQRNLTSKVLLVAGRGQVKKFHDLLETIEIYGEKIGNVFPEGENLIITADLKNYKNSDGSRNEDEFIKLLNKASELEKFENIHELLRALIELYKKTGKILEEFDHQFYELIDEFLDDFQELKILRDKYPGINENVNDNVRAVILNDVTQLSDYPDTINKFLEANIPVIVFSDRKVISIEDVNSFRELFHQRPNAYRLNWNKKKITSLIPYSEKLDRIEPIENEDGTLYYIDPDSKNLIPWTADQYIDQALWDQAIRYEDQTIRIESQTGSRLDIMAPVLLKHIKLFDEFEILQKSFYQNFYTAIYALKNSQNNNESILELVRRFESNFLSVRNQLPEDVVQDFVTTIAIAKKFERNTKSLDLSVNTFSINAPLEFDKSFSIPIELGNTNIPTNQTQKVVFTGYPFDEYRGKYLINSVLDSFVPKIEIKCWPNEASLTFNYLKRRLEGGYFLDHLPEGVKLDKSILIQSVLDIESEIRSYLLIDKNSIDDVQVELDLELVHQVRYKGYKSDPEGRDNWDVNCDVLNFEDGSFMFLAKGSRILCLTEGINGKPKVMKKSADEFFEGDKVFRYVKDRGAYVEISKRDPKIGESYQHLKFWRNKLQELYSINNSNTKDLNTSLLKVKKESGLEGNPTNQNLNRWLFDDEVISPDIDNLRLILTAAEVEEMEGRIESLLSAYKIAKNFRSTLSSRIKKEILKKVSKAKELNGDFEINLDGELIDVETRTVSTIDTNGVIVDYHSTRKILC